jgi:AraC-like DNA-binding protein
LKRYLERVLNDMPREDGFLASVRKGVAESMKNDDLQLMRIAKTVAMSPRTLQRRLKEYGMDFKKLVDDTRRRFALSYLKDRKNTLTENRFLTRLFRTQRI